MTPQLKAQLEAALEQAIQYAQNDHPAGSDWSDVSDACDTALAALRAEPDVQPDDNKRKAERLVRMLTDGYSGMKAVREVIALLEHWPDAAPQSAVPLTEPTKEMLDAGRNAYLDLHGYGDDWLRAVYKAMVSAQPPKGEAL